MKKIYITGCAKSGTTMLARMFHAFDSAWVIRDETPLENFVRLQKEQVGDYEFVVAKRSHQSILSNGRLTEADIARQEFLITRHNILIVNVIRDGRDVLVSWWKDYGLWAAFEWMSCLDALAKYRGSEDHRIKILNIRYEDILNLPNEVQRRVELFAGMSSEYYWSDYPRFVPDDTMFSTQYPLRPIDKSRMLKDPEFYKSRRPQDIEHFESLLRKYEYL